MNHKIFCKSTWQSEFAADLKIARAAIEKNRHCRIWLSNSKIKYSKLLLSAPGALLHKLFISLIPTSVKHFFFLFAPFSANWCALAEVSSREGSSLLQAALVYVKKIDFDKEF
ncbi:MAG: hypothetical protein V7K68_31870 [Nostoc sp.]|uniref:hypothetical protein n=1 Tax=Nostoc sp. TaxID=1180 RepID=UPI002FF55FEF